MEPVRWPSTHSGYACLCFTVALTRPSASLLVSLVWAGTKPGSVTIDVLIGDNLDQTAALPTTHNHHRQTSPPLFTVDNTYQPGTGWLYNHEQSSVIASFSTLRSAQRQDRRHDSAPVQIDRSYLILGLKHSKLLRCSCDNDLLRLTPALDYNTSLFTILL